VSPKIKWGGAGIALTAVVAAIVATVGLPANTVAPAVTGTPTTGQVLTCSDGTWTNSPTSYSRQWRRNTTNIGGATSTTYTLQGADENQSVDCRVTATNETGSASANSNAVTGQPVASADATCSSVTQYGITFTFNKAVPCGQFVNNDYWVTPAGADANVTITSITPTFSGGRNGWDVNPSDPDEVSYDSRLGGYDSTNVPALPYSAAPGSSIVKADSNDGSCCGSSSGHLPALTTAAVLTVLDDPPPSNGDNTFRPAYFGTDKTQFSATGMQTALLPELASVSGAPTLNQVRDRFQRVQLDHKSNFQGRYLHPLANFTDFDGSCLLTYCRTYGFNHGQDLADAALRLMLNSSDADEREALINYVQTGIDYWGMVEGGADFNADGGHMPGRKLPIAFASVMLDSAEMAATIASVPYDTFSEDGHIYDSAVAGVALWGQPCSAGAYDNNQATGSGVRDCRDDAQRIDGGEEPGAVYMSCCSSGVYKGEALAGFLMPEIRAIWDYEPLYEFAERYAEQGVHTSPDPESRYLGLHHTRVDNMTQSTFVDNMWDAYQ
jgi:hypothetical protein